ncbi:hypothetical protein ABZU53_24410 [Micromonospora sp. NPDC005194]|uniref:hypothetical protein n=1 Tax=Micromonospora sp. NPDC005194 TaxID=3156870 RepID=UPI0033ABD5F1
MKIDQHIRDAYRRQRVVASRLKNEVDKDIGSRKQPTWHYESRIKTEQSFALKVECGRPGNPNALEDFFGCVVVVPNYLTIADAVEMIHSLYGSPLYTRPASRDSTTKGPSEFRYDDLRLYLEYRDQGYGPPTGIAGTLFEVQVRTFLQHAWTIATHDVIYKSDDVSWRRERVAYQAKAALEQAEVTIASMADLERSPALPGDHKDFRNTNAVISLLKEHWSPEQLPTDVRRLATGILELLKKLNLGSEEAFRALLEAGRETYGGLHNLDWSPYRAVVQYLAEQHKTDFRRYVSKRGRDPIFLYGPVLEVLGLDVEGAARALVLPTQTTPTSAADSGQPAHAEIPD